MIKISSNFNYNLRNFFAIASFFYKLLTLGILFLTAVRAAVVAKLVILGVSFLTSFILVLRVLLMA